MKFTLLLSLIFAAFIGFSQEFPEDWEGDYSGQMILGNVHSPNDTVDVLFNIHEVIKDSVWTYKMTYHSKRYRKIVKDYIIKRERKGDQVNYILDELDGIEIEMSYMNGCFYNIFEVMDQLYISTMRLSDSDIHFELFAASFTKTKTTTLKEEEKEESEEKKDPITVNSYKPLLHQSVYLKRQ